MSLLQDNKMMKFFKILKERHARLTKEQNRHEPQKAVEQAMWDGHQNRSDKLTEGDLCSRKCAHKECLPLWKAYRQGKRIPKGKKNLRKREKEQLRQHRSYSSEYSALCQSMYRALVLLLSQILRAFWRLYNRKLLDQKRNNLWHQRELQAQSKELFRELDFPTKTLPQWLILRQRKQRPSLLRKVCERVVL